MLKKTWTTPAGAVYDLYNNMLQQPHLLVAGATGSGKSVVINGIMYTALFKSPAQPLCHTFCTFQPHNLLP